MPVCPSCKAAVPSPSGPCPRCGKALAGEVPDLALPARSSEAQPATRPAAPARPPAVAVLPQPGELDADSLGDDAVSLDLDLSKGPPMPSLAKAPAASPAGPAAAPIVRRAEVAAGGSDRQAAHSLAGYGEPPAQWFRAPFYAYRVLRRRPELKKLAAQKRRDASRARGAADDALTAFAELVRAKAETLGAYAHALDDVRATEQVMRDRDAVLGTETDAHRQRQAALDARLAELEAQLGQAQAAERGVQSELSEADALLKRAESRVKRVDIEIRNALEQAGMTPGDDPKGLA